MSFVYPTQAVQATNQVLIIKFFNKYNIIETKRHKYGEGSCISFSSQGWTYKWKPPAETTTTLQPSQDCNYIEISDEDGVMHRIEVPYFACFCPYILYGPIICLWWHLIINWCTYFACFCPYILYGPIIWLWWHLIINWCTYFACFCPYILYGPIICGWAGLNMEF